MFVHLPEGTEMVMPGDNVEMTVELIDSIAIEDGTRFSIRVVLIELIFTGYQFWINYFVIILI